MRSLIILCAINFSVAFAVLIVEPKNVAVFAGQKMSMECRANVGSTVRRWEVYSSTKIWSTVYAHGYESNFVNQFTYFGAQVDANGSGFIYTNSAKADDAGIYRCFARGGGRDVEASAQLIVFESEPFCETINAPTVNQSYADGINISMRCSIVFRGFWIPTMAWRRHDGKGHRRSRVGERIHDGVEVLRFPNNTVTTTLTIRINASAKDSFFSCQISFTQHAFKDVTVTATNFPEFFYFWSSEMTTRLDAEVCSATSLSALYFNFITVFFCFVLLCVAVVLYLKYKKRPSGITTELVEEQSIPMLQPVGVRGEQPPPAQDDTRNQMTVTNDQYSALESHSQSTHEQPTVYCELILYEQPHNVSN